MSRRVLIVCDGRRWFIRRVRVTEHDLTRDEMVYRCDQPIGRGHQTLALAVAALRRKPAPRTGKEGR